MGAYLEFFLPPSLPAASATENIETSIKTGLKGTEFKDRILHQQSHLIGKAEKYGNILQNKVVNNIVANVTAIMESKSGMEVIVANPTAGSCGTVGGLLKAVANDLNSNSEEIVKAYFAAGIVGAYSPAVESAIQSPAGNAGTEA